MTAIKKLAQKQTTNSKASVKITRWKIADLKPHPKQTLHFSDLSDVKLQRLAANIKANGLERPIEIRPDGTIIAGHQRVRATTLLGWTEIKVRVRHDLEALGKDAIENRFLEDNDRRDLSPLAQARSITRRWEMEVMKRGPNRRPEHIKGTLRDVIGRELAMSGRNLDRYLNLLKTPVEVQQAFEAEMLPLTLASRVAQLDANDQQKIAEAISSGGNPTEAVKSYLKTAKNKKRKVSSMMSLRDLEKTLAVLKNESDQDRYIRPEDVPTLEAARVLIDHFLEKRREADKAQDEAWVELLGEVESLDEEYPTSALAGTRSSAPLAMANSIKADDLEVGQTVEPLDDLAICGGATHAEK